MKEVMKNYLDMLNQAAHFVENQQHQNEASAEAVPIITNHRPASNTAPTVKENGSAESSNGMGSRTAGQPVGGEIPQHEHNKQPSSRRSNEQDEQAIKNRESMRMYQVNEAISADETASMAHYNHHSNGLLQHHRLYPDDKSSTLYRRDRSTESPAKSPPRKRSSSPLSGADSDHQPRNMVLPHQINSLTGAATQPMTHLPAQNPMIPFVHSLMYPSFDPALCADALARQGISINSDADRQQSPGSSPSTSSSSATVPMQGLPGFMYPFTNPGLLMGARGATAPGIGLSDISMLFPHQLAAYAPAANMLPQQLATLASLSEQEKRLFETMPNVAQHPPAHMVANPYFKNFCVPGIDATANKDVARSLPKSGAGPPGVGVPGIPAYTAEFFLRYQEAMNNEAMKLESGLASQASSSPAPRPSVSPESIKKSSAPVGYPFPVHYPGSYLSNSTGSSTKSPVPERKASTPTVRPVKNGTGQPHYESRPGNAVNRDRDSLYVDAHDVANGDDARRRLMAFARQHNAPADLYSAHFKSAHDRRSPSPYNERREYRRISRDLSPHRSSSSAEKSPKKRPHETYGIPRDLIPEIKTRSPGVQPPVGGTRATKSPQRGRSDSPSERIPQPPAVANPFSALTGKSALGLNDKDNPAYFTHPYMFHPALGGLATLPFAMPSAYLRQADGGSASTSKAVADAIAASSLATAASSQLYRPPLPSDALADYARLPGISPHIALLMPQQQAAFRPSLTQPTAATPTSQDYAAAFKQAALQQSLMLERGDKDRMASPSLQGVAPVRSYLPVSSASKLARGSPNPSHHKPISKHSSAYHHPSASHPYNAHTRTPPGHDGVDGRPIKRELSPSPGKKSSTAPPPNAHQRPTNSLLRRPEEERIKLKRGMEDDDRFPPKDHAMKRKREVTADANAPDIEEHFRRSLGDNYKESPSITDSVDDHFQKSLGNAVWKKINPKNKPASPEPADAVSNGREALYRANTTAPSAHLLPPYYHSAYASQLQAAAEGRHFSSLPYTAQATRNSAGNKMVKARGIVYPEMMSDPNATTVAGLALTRSTSSVSSNGRSDTSRTSPGNISEGSLYPPAYDNDNKVRNGVVTESNPPRTHPPISPANDNQGRRYNIAPPPNSSPRPTTSPGSTDKPLALQVPPHNRSHPSPPITSSYTSPSRPPPYSPQSSSSSAPPGSSPRRVSGEARSVEAGLPLQT